MTRSPVGSCLGSRLSLTIPVKPPPLQNERDKLHWAERSRLRQFWGLLIKNAIQNTDPAFDRPALERAEIVYRLYYPIRRRRDEDGMVGSTKPITDQLVVSGVLVDDQRGRVRVDVEEHIDRENPRVEIEITEVE